MLALRRPVNSKFVAIGRLTSGKFMLRATSLFAFEEL